MQKQVFNSGQWPISLKFLNFANKIGKQTEEVPLTPSLRQCSNKYKLAREGEKDKEKDEDIEKGK